MMAHIDGGFRSLRLMTPTPEIGENRWIDFFSKKILLFSYRKNFSRLGVVIVVIVVIVVVVVIIFVDVIIVAIIVSVVDVVG